MKIRKQTRVQLLTAASALIGLMQSIHSAPLILPPADVYSTSFEASEGYAPGTLNGQQGWTVSNGNFRVMAGGGDNPPSPVGSQMAGLVSGNESYVNKLFTNTPLTDDFYFSGLLAYGSDISAEGGYNGRFYLTSSVSSFGGPVFGIHTAAGGTPEFFYVGQGTGLVKFGIENTLSMDVFYRFQVAVDPGAGQFAISVYDFESNSLLASASSIPINGGVTSFSAVRLNGFSGSTVPVNYFDQLWISTTPVPEPQIAALVLSAAGLFVFARRKRSAVAK